MLLTLKIEILITNNGEENIVNVKTAPNNRVNYVATALELAKQNVINALKDYVDQQQLEFDDDEDKIEEFLNDIKMKDLA